MDIHEIRQEMKTKSIYDIHLRVTFYARVSSEKDEQLNSLDNQISYYKNLIQSNSAWEFVDGYIDEGLSGISTQKRNSFHRMINDAKLSKFDLIITKEISRFARNTLDSIQYTRSLLQNGVGVFFQNDNINTLDEDSELRLTIMSGIAQDELRKLSSRVKFGHQQAIKNGVVLGNSRIFGYDKQNKKLVINEKEAIMVQDLFELYSTNQYSLKQLENLFWERGYRNHNGNKIAHTTLSNIISNPKYKGYYVGNKVKVVDMFTKQQKFLPQEEWVMFKDESGTIVPAIVSEEIWDAANQILQSRSLDVKQRQNKCNHKNILTGKLFCTQCNAPFYRKDSRTPAGCGHSKWICSGKIKNGAKSCHSFALYEEEVIPILFEVFRETSRDIDSIIDKYVTTYKKANKTQGIMSRISALEKDVEKNEMKKDKLLEYNATGQISDEQFLKMLKVCEQEIENAQSEILKLKDMHKSNQDFETQIRQLQDIINNSTNDIENGVVNKEFIDKYIEQIFVTPIDKDNMMLNVKLVTGGQKKTTISKPANSKSRTGQMSFIMCPERHHYFDRINRHAINHSDVKHIIVVASL